MTFINKHTLVLCVWLVVYLWSSDTRAWRIVQDKVEAVEVIGWRNASAVLFSFIRCIYIYVWNV